jgi:hypothetical protein
MGGGSSSALRIIDPYWTLLPPLLALFYFAHPLADPDTSRAVLAPGPADGLVDPAHLELLST